MDENEQGTGRKPRVTTEDILDVFRSTADPVLSTAEVSDALPIGRRGVLKRLRKLEDEGTLQSKEMGGGTAWWPTEDAQADPTDAGGRTDQERAPVDTGNAVSDEVDAPQSPPNERRQETRRAESRPPTPDTSEVAPNTEDDVESNLSTLVDDVGEEVLPGSGAKLEERKEALRAAVDYLRDHGTATRSDFKNDVYPDHKARYTTGDDPAYSWWNNCIYDGLGELADRTGAIERAGRDGNWYWRGSDDLPIG